MGQAYGTASLHTAHWSLTATRGISIRAMQQRFRTPGGMWLTVHHPKADIERIEENFRQISLQEMK
jgi:hypothetical protein